MSVTKPFRQFAFDHAFQIKTIIIVHSLRFHGAQEAATELRTKRNELVQSFENDGFVEIHATKKAFSATLPEL